MGLTVLWHLTSLPTLLLLLGFVQTQDPQNYYFNSANSANRFVPSQYQNSRQPAVSSPYLSNTRTGSFSQPGSYQEQLLFISNENKPQSASSSSYSSFNPQFSQQRAPDFYDISPRPFGLPSGSGISSSPSGFPRPKAIRPSSALAQNGFQPSQSVRSNVPHQQTQFLSHFNDPASIPGDKASTSLSNRGQSNSFGSSPSRPFGNGGFSPTFTRTRTTSPNPFNVEQTEKQVQQPPFRNTRTRFQPSSSLTSSTSTTTDAPPLSTSKRYNRFGSNRLPNSGNSFRTSSTPTTTTSTTNRPERPSFSRVANKVNSLQTRRPSFISREPNEPLNLTISKKQRPFSFAPGRVKYNNKVELPKILKQKPQFSPSTTASLANANEDYSNEEAEEEEPADNHVEHEAIKIKSLPDLSLEKLGLHEGTSSTVKATDVPNPNEENQTVILTSNFFLPGDSDNQELSNSEDHSTLYSDEEDEATTIGLNEESITVTTPRTFDYEYEYTDEIETTLAPEQSKTTAQDPLQSETTKFSESDTTFLATTYPPTTITTTTQETSKETEAVSEAEPEAESEVQAEEELVLPTTEIPKIETPKVEAEAPKLELLSNDSSPLEAKEDPKELVDEKKLDQEAEAQEASEEYEDEEYDEEEEYDELEEAQEELNQDPPLKTSPPTTTTLNTKPNVQEREIISVVTTKSVVNGSTSFPSPVTPKVSSNLALNEEEQVYTENKLKPSLENDEFLSEEDVRLASSTPQSSTTSQPPVQNSTEGYVVIASIQTSRSINGARFLPFPAIEQEETKQTLSELERKIHESKNKKEQKKKEESSSEVTKELSSSSLASTESSLEPSSTPLSPSTESIIDKLDRVQSELSSGLLSGKYPLISQMEVSTPATSTTAGHKFVPNIRKFQPKTTPSPKVKIHHFDESDMDEVAGLLPVGFKPKSYKNRKITTSTSTTTSTTENPLPSTNFESKKPSRNSTISRSFKNGPVPGQELTLSSLLPKGYKVPNSSTTTTEKSASSPADLTDIFSELSFDDESLAKLLPKDYKLSKGTEKPAVTVVDDISKFLPPGYKLNASSEKPPIMPFNEDISKFLPPGYKPPNEESSSEEAIKNPKLPNLKPIAVKDISKFLPPGFKLTSTTPKPSSEESAFDISKLLPKDYRPSSKGETEKDTSLPDEILSKVQFKEVANLLPPGYNLNSSKPIHPASTTTTTSTTPSSSGVSVEKSETFSTNSSVSSSSSTSISSSSSSSSSSGPSGFKVVFPKGIHKRPGGNRLTTPRSTDSEGPTSPAVVIKKGPPTRATTEFTGWPTPSTTPISIEKLLEQARTQTINLEDLLSSSTTTTTTTSTTTTTTTTPKPTKPGHCTLDCDLAATIKIIDGVKWKPELLDHNTVEWKSLAREVESQLNEVYSSAPQLNKWYKKVRIDSFSQGSVLVDYYVELANITTDVNTLEIKKLFHDALTHPTQPIIPEKPLSENETDSEDDSDEIFKDPMEEKLVKETFQMGKYIIDPAATDFSVIPKISPNVDLIESDLLIPQWAIVVIVIGVGSLIFVVIFGVTVLLNRQKRAKKTPIPLTNDMLNELKVNHMGGSDNYGVDDFYNIDDPWSDTKQPIKPKRFTNSVHDSSGSNIYDSWRSTRHGGDYFYDAQHTYSQKGDSLKRPIHQSHQQPHSAHSGHSHHSHQSYHQNPYQYGSHPSSPYHQNYPDAFADAHPMYTYNNHSSRPRYSRDYDPDF